MLKGTLIPRIAFSEEFLSLLVAVIGTTLSAYLYTWQSNEEVEEEIAMGRRRLADRRGASRAELEHTRRDVLFGMVFSNTVMYFIILATGSTLYTAGRTDITSAADAAKALEPLAGAAAGALFALGIVGVGFLAVPVMTTGAAYDLCQALGWKHGLHAKPHEAKRFYGAIAGFTAVAIAMNFAGINPMKALVFAGVVQGFSTPPLLLLITLMTSNRHIMGNAIDAGAGVGDRDGGLRGDGRSGGDVDRVRAGRPWMCAHAYGSPCQRVPLADNVRGFAVRDFSAMPVSVICPHVSDAALRSQLFSSVREAIKRWRPGFEKWQLTLFRSQSGDGWDLAIRGPRFRKVLTLHGPLNDLPGLVSAYVDAVLANA